jgi:hypothetical protein
MWRVQPSRNELQASISEDFQVIVNRTIDLAGNWQILSVTRHGTIHSVTGHVDQQMLSQI